MLREINPFDRGDEGAFKRNKYESAVASKLVKAITAKWGLNPNLVNRANSFHWDADSGYSPMQQFMQDVPSLCIGLTAFRPKQVTLHQLISRNINRLDLWTEFTSVQSLYPHKPAHGVVFDVHGDGIPDLVLHTMGEIPGSVFTLIRTEDNIRLYICEFSALLDRVVESRPF